MVKNDTKKISKSLKEGLYDLYGQLIEATEALDAPVYKRVYHQIVQLTETVVAAFGSDPHPTAIELRENIKLAQDVFVDIATARAQKYRSIRNRPVNSIEGPMHPFEFFGRAHKTARDALEQPILLDQLKLRRDRLKRLPVKAMSVSMANTILRDLAESQPGFADKPIREIALIVGCSYGLIQRTTWWKANMEVTGRGRGPNKSKTCAASERPLTAKILAARPDGKQVNINAPDVGDDELRTLIESDKDTEEQITRLAASQASKGR